MNFMKLVKFLALVCLALLAYFLISPGWGRAEHEALDSIKAGQLAVQEAKHKDLLTTDANPPCLVSRSESPTYKMYIFEFREKTKFFVYVASTPESYGLDTRVLSTIKMEDGGIEAWADKVDGCGRSP